RRATSAGLPRRLSSAAGSPPFPCPTPIPCSGTTASPASGKTCRREPSEWPSQPGRETMKVEGRPTRTIWVERPPADGQRGAVGIIDQTRLPHAFATESLETPEDAARAIRDMLVRGAPLIGITAAYGIALALHDDPSDARLREAHDLLLATRPTAVNLRWALEAMMHRLRQLPEAEREAAAWIAAGDLADEDAEICRTIGVNGLPLI